MAWIMCILMVFLFQASTNGADIAYARLVREGEKSENQKPNGSYKILNRFVKPFINRRAELGSFIFPDLTSRGQTTTPIIPDNCKLIGICEDIPNYPEEIVSRLLKEIEKRNITNFNKDVLEIPKIAERIGPEAEDIELCYSVQRLYSPRAAMDVNNDWHFIVNDKKKSQQSFSVEICHNQNSACSSLAYFQNGYQARCVQKYMLRKMIALNKQNEPVELPLQVPSCCSCVARAA